MTNDINYVMIETLVRKMLREVRKDSRRSARNLIDFAVHFSDGRFQSRFFEIAHQMLKNENSPYFELFSDTARNIDEEHLIRMGMNIGFNSFIDGCRKIRDTEEKEGYYIPWAIYLSMKNRDIDYLELLKEGENLGIYSWFIYGEGDVDYKLNIISKMGNSAFFLYINPEDLTDSLVSKLKGSINVMTMLKEGRGLREAALKLREARLPYSFSCRYRDINDIEDEDRIRELVNLHPVFIGYSPEYNVSNETVDLVYKRILEYRTEQYYSSIFWDVINDDSYINDVISSKDCNMGFDEEGNMCFCDRSLIRTEINIRDNKLSDILKNRF